MGVTVVRPKDLPDFRKPPLTELVLSLQFETIAGLTTAHVGVLWERFRNDLPVVEEHPPLPPVIEAFGPLQPTRLEVTIEEKPPLRRVWFLNQSKTELIQVQADRFIHNWRQGEGREAYPRYESVRDHFRKEAGILEQFLRDESLGELQLSQCEVTYLNHIDPSGVWQRQGQLEAVMRNWTRPSQSMFLGEPEDVGVHLRFIIPDNQGKAIGRLHATIQPAWRRTDNRPILALNLTARGKPLHEGIEGAFAFFDLGREWIVKGFRDLTTPEMHRVWEATNV